MDKTIRVIEHGVAFGNYKGRCFDYIIDKQELIIVDPLGKPQPTIEDEITFELLEYLTNYFK